MHTGKRGGRGVRELTEKAGVYACLAVSEYPSSQGGSYQGSGSDVNPGSWSDSGSNVGSTTGLGSRFRFRV